MRRGAVAESPRVFALTLNEICLNLRDVIALIIFRPYDPLDTLMMSVTLISESTNRPHVLFFTSAHVRNLSSDHVTCRANWTGRADTVIATFETTSRPTQKSLFILDAEL